MVGVLARSRRLVQAHRHAVGNVRFEVLGAVGRGDASQVTVQVQSLVKPGFACSLGPLGSGKSRLAVLVG